MTLYRQAQIYVHQGIELERSTLADEVGQAAFHLRRLREHLLGKLRQRPKPFADDRQARSDTDRQESARIIPGSHTRMAPPARAVSAILTDKKRNRLPEPVSRSWRDKKARLRSTLWGRNLVLGHQRLTKYRRADSARRPQRPVNSASSRAVRRRQLQAAPWPNEDRRFC
ncbi:IS66 family transposase [Bradyrhizobium sp. CIR3A]|uniref:IS66 family transposase n=1 Tax=Bradyrhizobium sp. CIR3A TaxID=2663838 RepID=UPI001FED8029|nr:IS66 family transposase [Bradyrhizobium sp. CIR3A]